MFGNLPPFFQALSLAAIKTWLQDQALTLTSTLTINKTPQASASEVIAQFKVTGVSGADDGDNVAFLNIENATTSDDLFVGQLRGRGSGNNDAMVLRAEGTTDSGTRPVMVQSVRTVGLSAIATRPAFSWENNGTVMSQISGAGRWTNTVSALSNSAAAHAWTNGTITAGLYLGTTPDLQFGTTTNHTVFLLQNNANRVTLTSTGANVAGSVTATSGDVVVATAGKGVKVKEGSNATMGTATLVGGTATVSTTAVTASSRIFLTKRVGGGTRGTLEVGTITAGTSFVINSVDSAGALVADTSTVSWIIVEPAP